MSFNDKTVAITGAAGNLGRALAAAFADSGAKLILLDVNKDSLEAAFPGNDPAKLKLAVNLLDAAAVTAAVTEAAAKTGGIDVLCAIAGGFHMGEPVHKIPSDKWNLMLDMNAGTLLNTVQAVVPAMLERRRGKIITIGANAAHKGMADMGAYCAGKSVVMRLSESMSAELRQHGINVNCVLPSIIDTPENRAAMPKADPGNWVAPQQLAAVILFLASDAAAAVHGALIPVTGLS